MDNDGNYYGITKPSKYEMMDKINEVVEALNEANKRIDDIIKRLDDNDAK